MNRPSLPVPQRLECTQRLPAHPRHHPRGAGARHAGSEHTIDDKQMDLEMQTVHNPKTKTGGIVAAAMGIMFSVNDYNVKS